MKNDEDALRNSLALLSAGVTRLPAMTVRTSRAVRSLAPPCPFFAIEPAVASDRTASSAASQDRDDRGDDLSGAGVRLLRRRAHGTLRFEHRDSDGGVAARQRRAGPGGPRREPLLLADRSEQGRPAAEGAAQAVRRRRGETVQIPQIRYHRPAIRHYRPPDHRARDPSSASGRGRLAPDVRRRRLTPPGADHELPPRAGLPAARRGRCLDRPHAHERDAVPGHLGAGRDDALARAGGGSDEAALRPRRDVQQRVQVERFRGRVRL